PNRWRSSTSPNARLLESRVFRPCCLENRNVRVGVLPERQEIVIGAFRLHGVAREREYSPQLQARHRVHGIDEDEPSVMENPLEFGGGFGGLTCCEVGQTANIDEIQTFDGRSHTGTVPQTADLVYQGSVCGPNVKGGGN